jgi:hypothetical protein
MPSARFAVNAATRRLSRVLPPMSPSNRRSNDRAAPSSSISIVAALSGVTSRMNQCNGSCPGIRVVPRVEGSGDGIVSLHQTQSAAGPLNGVAESVHGVRFQDVARHKPRHRRRNTIYVFHIGHCSVVAHYARLSNLALRLGRHNSHYEECTKAETRDVPHHYLLQKICTGLGSRPRQPRLRSFAGLSPVRR